MENNHQCTSSEKEVTVGQTWTLNCEQGQEKKLPTKESVTEAVDPYQIVILDKQIQNDGRYHFKVTSYRVGKHESAVLQDGNLMWRVPEFEVVSVLQKEDKGFGPLIIEGIALPAIYWILPLFFIFVLILFVSGIWWKRQRQKKQLSLMEVHLSTTPAHLEFYARSRQLLREINTEEALKQLQRHLLFYIARKEKIPTYYWSSKKIFSYLKKRGLSKKMNDRLAFLIHEISALQAKFKSTESEKAFVLREDFENILRWSAEFVENFEKETSRDIS